VEAGAVVSFNCTLDTSCANGKGSFVWTHYSKPGPQEIWYKKGTVSPKVESSGVNVEEDQEHGMSVLTIPRTRLKDGGRFICHVTKDSIHCRMNF